jgi:DNA-3-methyladenine glycosylase
MELVDRALLAGAAPAAAHALLNKLLVSDVGDVLTIGRIVEVEAYDESDPASHTYRGRTPRNSVMFGPPGHLYAYLSYGIHTCANVVCGPPGAGAAVLLRALAPVAGVTAMERRRGRSGPELVNGPGKLTQALGIGLGHDGVDLLDPLSPVRLCDDGLAPPDDPTVTRRVGISVGVETPWRFLVPADPG